MDNKWKQNEPFGCEGQGQVDNRGDCFKEAVCISAPRIYDSCSDKDCIEDLKLEFSDCDQEIVNNAINARIKKAELITAFLDLEPVTFNRGFYSVDVTYVFCVAVEVVLPAPMPCKTIFGYCVFNKKVILYGSEGCVRVFTSEYVECDNDTMSYPDGNCPRAVIQVADPIALSAELVNANNCCNCCSIPRCVQRKINCQFGSVEPKKNILVTLGLFSIIQIQRDVQMLIPAYDFCIPEKECVITSDNPCELFKKLDFPTDEFFPPKQEDSNDCGCR